MRCSLVLLLAAALAGCGKRDGNAFRRIVLTPIEDLRSAGGPEAAAMQLAVWDALQAQHTVHVVMAQHRRELAGLPAYAVLEGYVDGGGFRLTFNGEPVGCEGTLETCAGRVVTEVAGRMGARQRQVLSAGALRCLAGAGNPDECLAQAVKTDGRSALVWLRLAGRAMETGGPAAALAVLGRADVESMEPFDRARVRLAAAEWRQDRIGAARALVSVAGASPADVDLQGRAAQAALSVGDYTDGLALYEALLARVPDPRVQSRAAFAAALAGDRAKAERLAEMACAGAKNDAEMWDSRGEIAYFYRDFDAASRYFEEAASRNVALFGGLDLWKSALAARQAGQRERAEAFFRRFLELRAQAGQRNPLILQAVWAWLGGEDEAAVAKLGEAAQSSERGKALFLRALIALHQRDFGLAGQLRREMDPASIETGLLASLLEDVAPPPGLPFPAEAVGALRAYLRGDLARAKAGLVAMRAKTNPGTAGQWRKFEGLLAGEKTTGTGTPSPEEWLAVVLR